MPCIPKLAIGGILALQIGQQSGVMDSRCWFSVITATFTRPRRKSLFPKAARPAAPCATYCYHASELGASIAGSGLLQLRLFDMKRETAIIRIASDHCITIVTAPYRIASSFETDVPLI